MISKKMLRRVGILALALSLNACGGSDDHDSTTGTSSTSTSSTGTTASPPASGSSGISLAQSSYTIAQNAVTLTVSVARSNATAGAVSVSYSTTNGSAIGGTDFTPVSGTLSWAADDTSSQAIAITVSNAVPFVGSRSFNVVLSSPVGSATLGSPAAATITIDGVGTTTPTGSPGSIALSAATYAVAQSAGTMTVTALRTGGSTGAVGVNYATANGSAVSGTDYSATSGSLNWADGDTAAKTFSIGISTATPFTGSRSFEIALSASGGSSVGTPGTATATITGSGAVGSVALSASSYAVAQSTGTLAVTASRSGGSGAVNVSYATANGTAMAGTDYSATNGTLSWADGDVATKTFTIAIAKSTPFSGSREFTIGLSSPSGGGTLGSPNQATATITGSGAPGSLALSTTSYSVLQSAGSLTVTAMRSSGSTGAVTVGYATSNGSAVAGTDYTATSGTLSWAAGDTSAKTFSVTVSKTAPFSGTRNFHLVLSGNSGGAALGAPSTAMATITGSSPATAGACAETSSSWKDSSQGGNIFDWKQYGNYLVNVDNWGNLPGQATWANGAACWGVTASASNTDIGQVRTYPHVTRGWAESSSMTTLSSPGTNDWTTQAGLGISVTQLTKARMHWAFQAPLSTVCSPYCRWDALADIYFHTTATPAPSEWPPTIDLQIIPALADQVVNNSTFYALVAANDFATTVTIGGNAYMVFIDDAGGASFHQPGGHTIAIFNLPTAYTSNNNNPNWGVQESVTDIAAVIKYFMQANPIDDAGKPLKTAAGTTVTSPLIPSNVFLTAINAGWEIDVGALFTSTAFCVAMQDEPDCQ